MIIHAVFMTHTEIRPDEARLIRDRQCRCLQTAESTIDLMYETFRTDEFFQTWYALYLTGCPYEGFNALPSKPETDPC
jgi:hypothetical protein